MVFGKQHLSLFVALALAVYANALPSTALANPIPSNVERLRGDLHQFIELIISCLTNSKTHANLDPAQVQHFKDVTANLQEDVGIQQDNGEHPESRKFDSGKSGEVSGETSNEEQNESGQNSAGQTSAELEEQENRREFDIQGVSHGFTPRPGALEITETSTTTTSPTSQPEDIGLRRLKDGSDGGSSAEAGISTPAPKITLKTWEEANHQIRLNQLQLLEELEKTNPEELKQLLDAQEKASPEIFKELIDDLEKISPERTKAILKHRNKSNESKEKTDDEIQVRNLIQEQPKYATDSSVHPYDALHVYGVRGGPINKIVFEGGEHHPPRPLTIKESKHLKEFIKMVVSTNQMQSPMATFPTTGEDASPRAGFKDHYYHGKSPWASRPVPLELV